jgi:uncharacterized protein (TIGR00369 family)
MEKSTAPVDDGKCFVCGPDNPHGMHMRFQRVDDEGSSVYARITLAEHFQGWQGVAHGGIVLALLDEAMAYSAVFAGYGGMTASVSVRFRKPVPLNEELLVRGHIVSMRRNILFIEANIADADGVVLAEGEGKFVSMGTPNIAWDLRGMTAPK